MSDLPRNAPKRSLSFPLDFQALTVTPKEHPLIPPLEFGCVGLEIYRGSYPKPIFTRFLDHLALRTVVTLSPDPLPEEITSAFATKEISFVHIPGVSEQHKSKKKREIPLTLEHIAEILCVLNDERQRPIYLHCLNGRQATSLVVACLRITQGWSVRSAFAELSRHCDYDRKDISFIEKFKAVEFRFR